MLSRWSVKLLNAFWKFAYFLRVTHYYPQYQTENGQLYLKISSSSLRISKSYIAIPLYNLYPLFILYQIIQLYGIIPDKFKVNFLVKMVYMLLAYTYGFIYQMNRIYRWNDIPNLQNKLLNFFQFRKVLGTRINASSVLPEHWRREKPNKTFSCGNPNLKSSESNGKLGGLKLKKYIIVPIGIGIIINLFNILLIMKKPNLPHFVTSLFCKQQKCDHALRLPVSIYHVWVWFYNWVY